MIQKIFNIGFPKTGTTSLNKALTQLGFISIHNPKGFRKQAMEGCYRFEPDNWQAITNFGEHFYPQLDQAYPDSKFILTVRDEHAWIASLKRQFGKSTGDEVGARWKWSRKIRTFMRMLARMAGSDTRITHMHARIDIFGTYKFHADRCLYVYRLHQKNVREYFQDRPNDFLVMNIPAGDGWEQLCPFLEIEHWPDTPFPHQQPIPAPHA